MHLKTKTVGEGYFNVSILGGLFECAVCGSVGYMSVCGYWFFKFVGDKSRLFGVDW